MDMACAETGELWATGHQVLSAAAVVTLEHFTILALWIAASAAESFAKALALGLAFEDLLHVVILQHAQIGVASALPPIEGKTIPCGNPCRRSASRNGVCA
jgi:hypothetical protein